MKAIYLRAGSLLAPFLAVWLSAAPSATAAQDGAMEDEVEYERLAPYADITWPGGEPPVPRVLFDDEWFHLVAIEGVTVREIVAFARDVYGDAWQKRFDEDLVEVLTRMGIMGHPPPDSVDLRLQGAHGGREIAAPLTAVNRALIMRAKRMREREAARPERLDAAAALEDIDVFEAGLRRQFAYLEANDVPLDSALAALRERVAGGIVTDSFGVELQGVIALFIDGHAAITGHDLPTGYLPFLVDAADGGFVAYREDRRGLLDAAHPYLVAIDGRPLPDWFAAADPYIVRGSTQYVGWQRRRLLRNIQFLRSELGIARTDSLTVALADADGSTVERTLPVAAERPLYGDWPRTQSGRLDGDIGYLRIAAMDDQAVDAIRTWLPRFEDTRGLIIDVRGNGGGSRDALLELSRWLPGIADGPRVANIAAYRLDPEFDEDHLEARYMYRERDPHWTSVERAAIAAARASFEPEWMPPEGQFSEWHYLVLAPDTTGRRPYTAPVVVLQDEKGFSATDIFLGALADLKGVTLIGTASSGGSARSQRFELPNSLLTVRVASMVSFRPDGRLYDTRGIEPDVVVEPSPEYYVDGEDLALEAAIRGMDDEDDEKEAP